MLAALCLAGCAGLDALTDAENERVATFDYYWQQLADRYPLFGSSQVSWPELRRRYRAAAPFAVRPHEFYHLLTGMFSELGDPHVSFAVPPERWRTDDRDDPTTSLLELDGFRVMPIEGRLHVVQWPAGGEPVQPRGLPATARYPQLWRVGGFPVVASLVGNLLQGPPGTPVDLQLRWRDGTVTRHVLHRPLEHGPTRGALLGHLDHANLQLAVRDEDAATRIELATLGPDLPLARFDEYLDRAATTEGLVLDLRKNLGGNLEVAERAIGRLLREPADIVFVGRDFQGGLFGLVHYDVFLHTTWTPREPRFDKPLVVLTSTLTASMAEHAARLLQRHGAALVVGERTAGAEAGIETVEGPDGAVLKFGGIRVIDRTGVGLQREGVVPDVAVPLTLADVERLGPDLAVRDWEDRLTAAAGAALARLTRSR